MRTSPSIVPADRLDRDIYLVLDTDLETVLQGLLSGQYSYPVRIVCSNAGEGWARDATSDVADAVAQRAVDNDDDISAVLQDFIDANGTRRFDVQLALPLQGAA